MGVEKYSETNSVVNEHSVITNRFLSQMIMLVHKLSRLKQTKMAGPKLFVITEFHYMLITTMISV